MMIKVHSIEVSPDMISYICDVEDLDSYQFRMELNTSDLEQRFVSVEPDIYTRLAHGLVVRAIEKYGIDEIPPVLYGAWG